MPMHTDPMQHELTPDQAREIVRLRGRHPDAEVTVHQRPWGIIVELRRGSRTVALRRFSWTGETVADSPIHLAA
jgi:hypothetical protein